MKILHTYSMLRATLKDTLDRLPGGLLITDRQSRVLYASRALERRTGFSVAEIVGKKPGELWGGKMRKPFYAALWQTIEAEHRPFVGEVKNIRKNGAKQDEHIFILPIRDHLGVTQYFAEVHPELLDRESELAFGKEFLARADGATQDRNFFFWMFQKLGQHPDGTMDQPVQPAAVEDFQDGASFFKKALIGPMEKVFARRTEDALLIARAQGNPELFGELYTKYAGVVREYFLRRLQGHSLAAEDLMQEVFIRSFHSLSSFRMTNASYFTYLLRVAHNVLVNYYRRQRHDTVPLSGSEEQLGAILAEESVSERTMDFLLEHLTETERAIMLAKYRDGLKVKVIAGQFGKTENAVKLILSRTRKKMKKSLQ
jgi:RNA polymerase sigma factor (sigma-70 family)